MSDDLYATVLRWRAGAGLAKLRNRSVALADKPAFDFEFEELHYRHDIAYSRLKLANGMTREMRPEEMAACYEFLRAKVEHST